jgi:signal transduction histidine kinase
MIEALDRLGRQSRGTFVILSLVALAVIGLVDYLTGFEIMFSAFYLLVVGLVTWFVGKGFGLLMSVLSIAIWIGGDLAAGAHYSNPGIAVWNALILLVLYLMVVLLVSALRSLQRDLESRVEERTQALRREMAERERLEEEILQVSEREQRRIGHDLHDSLCQHLTATALAGQVLGERLTSKCLPEAADASKVVALVEDGIALARNLARGLYPVDMEAEGLMDAFRDLAQAVTQGGKIRCVFECSRPVLIHNDAAATQLYRIAQEAVRNAIQHGKPRRIGITLAQREGQVTLTVEDDGIGIPEPAEKSGGLGIHIMAHRAAMIGGFFSVDPGPTGGTIVTCSFQEPSAVSASQPKPETIHDLK